MARGEGEAEATRPDLVAASSALARGAGRGDDSGPGAAIDVSCAGDMACVNGQLNGLARFLSAHEGDTDAIAFFLDTASHS